MGDARRGLNWRLAWIAAAVIVIVIWRAASGGPQNVIQIQFGMAPEILEGAEVVIDGAVAGTLSKMGARAVSGFKVEDGEHTLELRVDGYAARPTTVTSGPDSRQVMLMVDFTERVTPDGGTESVVVLY